MSRAYPDHNVHCSKTFRRIMQTNGLTSRFHQCGPRKGMPALLRHLSSTITPEIARQNVYLIKLPTDEKAKLTLQHPIKQIARSAWRGLALKTPFFDSIWRAFIRLASDNSDRLFVVCYAPDLSYGMIVGVSDPPVMQQVFCPCSAHNVTSAAPKQTLLPK